MPFAATLKTRLLLPMRRRLRPLVEVPTADGIKMTVDVRDVEIGTKLYLGRAYERAFIELLRHAQLDGRIAVDVGANIGLYTLPLSRYTGPRGRVFAFEPEHHNFELLSRNIELNGAVNVTAIEAAASDRNGHAPLALSPTNYGDHYVVSKPGAAGPSARLVTLDDTLASTLPGSVGVIKIDVQGHEPAVLRGARETLARNPGAVILIELAPRLLQRGGYSAAELLEIVRDFHLSGWEINSYRISPIAEPSIYDAILDSNEETLILCRDPDVLRALLSRYYQTEIPPAANCLPC